MRQGSAKNSVNSRKSSPPWRLSKKKVARAIPREKTRLHPDGAAESDIDADQHTDDDHGHKPIRPNKLISLELSAVSSGMSLLRRYFINTGTAFGKI